MKARRYTRRYNPRLPRVRRELTVCLPSETWDTIRATAVAERRSLSSIVSETLVAVFGGAKGYPS